MWNIILCMKSIGNIWFTSLVEPFSDWRMFLSVLITFLLFFHIDSVTGPDNTHPEAHFGPRVHKLGIIHSAKTFVDYSENFKQRRKSSGKQMIGGAKSEAKQKIRNTKRKFGRDQNRARQLRRRCGRRRGRMKRQSNLRSNCEDILEQGRTKRNRNQSDIPQMISQYINCLGLNKTILKEVGRWELDHLMQHRKRMSKVNIWFFQPSARRGLSAWTVSWGCLLVRYTIIFTLVF